MPSAAEAARLDEKLFSIRDEQELIQIAGKVVADITTTLVDESERILFACGPGNNGADGLAAAILMAQRYPVRKLSVYCPRPKFGHFLQRLLEFPNVERVDDLEQCDPCALVDCIFGFSEHLPLRDPYKKAVSLYHRFRVISVDIPTGYEIDAETGAPEYMPHALISLTAPKPCHAFAKVNGARCFVGGNFCTDALALEFGIASVRERLKFQGEDGWYEDK